MASPWHVTKQATPNPPFEQHDPSNLEPDLDETARFLRMLDKEAEKFALATFDDNADRKDGRLARRMYGTLSEYAPYLIGANRKGAGVFITVNQTDGKGYKNPNIIKARYLWYEDDSGKGITPPLEPHIAVESSPGKFHHYFRADGVTLEQFDQLMAHMVELGSDPNAKDRARVLRLPGFYHQKVDSRKGLIGTPFMVRVVGGSLWTK